MNVVQSYLTSIIKGNFSLYEVRLFTKIVEYANRELEGKRVKDFSGPIRPTLRPSYELAIPFREILTDGSNDVEKVFSAAQNLANKSINYYSRSKKGWVSNTYRDKSGTTNYYSHLVESVRWTRGTGVLYITVSYWLMCYILDIFGHNFSMYNLEHALSLPTAYAVRMYWLVSSATRPIPYPVQMLRDLLGVGNKYPSTKDFIKRCIESPRKILEERGVNGFTYKVIHKYANSKTSKITAILIIPVQRELPSDSQIAAKGPLSVYCSHDLQLYLQTQCLFTDQELYSLKLVLADFQALDDFRNRLVRIVSNARKKGAGKGYIVNAMKSEILENKRLGQPLHKSD